MSEHDKGGASTGCFVAIGCLVLLLLVVVVGSVLFVMPSRTTTVVPAGGGVHLEVGYLLVPGEVRAEPDGTRRATIRIELTEDWTLTELRELECDLKRGTEETRLKLLSTPPTTPVGTSFDLVFELPPPPEADEGTTPVVERLRLHLRTKAKTGFMGIRSASSDASDSWVVEADRLRPDSP